MYAGTGQVGRVAAGVGSLFGGFFSSVTATHSPTPTVSTVSIAPSLTPPSQPDTNQAKVVLTGSVPLAVVGKSEFTINLYQALKGQAPARVLEGFPVPTTPVFTISDVTLQKGSNAFTITLVGPGGESVPSKPVVYVLDQTPPKIAITSPAKDTTINAPTAA